MTKAERQRLETIIAKTQKLHGDLYNVHERKHLLEALKHLQLAAAASREVNHE